MKIWCDEKNLTTGTKLAVGCALALLTLVVYGNSITSEFVSYDDPLYILERPEVWEGLSLDTVRWALTSTSDANWIPLTWLSYLLDVTLFGVNAPAHHAVNLLLHLASTLLLLTVLQRMTGRFWRSALVAALFALHPMHVESVAWIAERKDVLSGLLFMLILLAYHRYVRAPSLARYLSVLLLFALGLCAKSMLVTLPFVLLLLDYWPLERWSQGTREDDPATVPRPEREKTGTPLGRLVVEKLPFIGLAFLSGIITLLAQKRTGAVAENAEKLPIENIANALVGYGAYILKSLAPTNLAVFYPFDFHIPVWKVVMAALCLVAITALAVRVGKVYRYAPVGWFWFLVMLLPVIGIIPVGSQAMADRYTYLPYIGLFLVYVWGLADAARHYALPAPVTGGMAVVVVSIFSFLTWQQVGYWRNNTTLFSHALEVTDDNWVAYEYLGTIALMQSDFPKALEYTAESLRINPRNANGHVHLSIIYRNLRNDAKALDCLNEALRVEPRSSAAHLELGKQMLFTGDIGGALQQYRILQTIDPYQAQSLMSIISQTGALKDADGK